MWIHFSFFMRIRKILTKYCCVSGYSYCRLARSNTVCFSRTLLVSCELCVCIIISTKAGSLHISRVYALHSTLSLSHYHTVFVLSSSASSSCVLGALRIKSDRANVLHPHEIIVAVRFYTCTTSPFSCDPFFSFPSYSKSGLSALLLLLLCIIEYGSGYGDGERRRRRRWRRLQQGLVRVVV